MGRSVESPCPFPGHRPRIREKVFLIAFRLILPKILPRARIFTRTIMNYLENLIGTTSFKMKQYPAGYLPELHSLDLLLTKNAQKWPSIDIAFLPLEGMDCLPPFSRTFSNQKFNHSLPPEINLHPPLKKGRVT